MTKKALVFRTRILRTLLSLSDAPKLISRIYSYLSVDDKRVLWSNHSMHGSLRIDVPGLPSILMVQKDDDVVLKELFWTGYRGWEFFSLNLWSTLLKQAPPDFTVIDIGSYSGIYSIYAKKIVGSLRVIACDIQKICVDRVKENAKLNALDIEPEQIAIGLLHEQPVKFFHNDGIGGMTSVASLTPNRYSTHSSEVRGITLDIFCDEKGVDIEKIGPIKIDAEGSEVEILEGMKRVLSRFPDILIEVNTKQNLRRIRSLLPGGYRIYNVTEHAGGGSLREVTGIRSTSNFGRNFLLTTKRNTQIADILSATLVIDA